MFETKSKPDLIIDKLYLGNLSCAENITHLQSLKISHILVAGNCLDQLYPNDFTYKQIFVNDYFTINIKQFFDETYEYN